MQVSSTLPLPVAKALARLRRERCVSQQQLADLAGVSLNTIWRMERGVTTYPTARTLHRLATGLGITEQALRQHLGMRPSRTTNRDPAAPEVPGARSFPSQETQPIVSLLEALVAQWPTLTPEQQAYAEAICHHLVQTLCIEPNEQRRNHP
jgi:transcriptional regulator with XRE-family HTH domain